MPQPEGAQLNFGYSPILTTVGLSYLPKLDQFAARKIFPVIPTAVSEGTYNVWTAGDFLRRNGKKIANYEAVPLGGFSTTQQTFSVHNWGVGTPWTNRDLANARRGGMTDQAFKNAKVRWVVTQGLLELEFRVKDLIQTTANWSTTVAGIASNPVVGTSFLYWDNAASTPVDDIDNYKRRMRLATGFVPNTLVIPELVLMALKRNPQVISRVTPGFYGAGKAVPVQVSVEQLKILFDIPNIITPLSTYNSAGEGLTPVLTDIWSNTVWLGYVTQNPGPEEATAGYMFSWTGDTSVGLPAGMQGGAGPNNLGSVMNNEGLFMREYIDQPRASVVIEGMLWTSPNIVGAPLGMTFTDPLTP